MNFLNFFLKPPIFLLSWREGRQSLCCRNQNLSEDDKLYISAIFDCFDVTVLGLAIADPGH